MALLGKFVKQPDEVESYSIQLNQAISGTDEVVGAYVLLVNNRNPNNKVRPKIPTTLSADLVNSPVISVADLVLPTVAEEGRFYISNAKQDGAINISTVGGLVGDEPTFELAARSGVILKRRGLDFIIEASADAVLVSSPSDQRVRVFMSGGDDGFTYKLEATASTAEGRVLQDEFLVKIKDI